MFQWKWLKIAILWGNGEKDISENISFQFKAEGIKDNLGKAFHSVPALCA